MPLPGQVHFVGPFRDDHSIAKTDIYKALDDEFAAVRAVPKCSSTSITDVPLPHCGDHARDSPKPTRERTDFEAALRWALAVCSMERH